MRSLDQIRAAHAYQAIAHARNGTREISIKLPTMLQVNGLLATWAHLLAKKTAVVDDLLEHLRYFQDLEIPQGEARNVFLHWVGGHQQNRGGLGGPRLRAITAEALAFTVWLKRAAEAWEENRNEGQEGGSDG